MLVKAGSGVATLGIPGSAGVPAETAMHTLALPFNDLDAVRAVFAARPDEIACIIVEPVVGNAGTIPPAPGYLEAVRQLCDRRGALYIADEIFFSGTAVNIMVSLFAGTARTTAPGAILASEC